MFLFIQNYISDSTIIIFYRYESGNFHSIILAGYVVQNVLNSESALVLVPLKYNSIMD